MVGSGSSEYIPFCVSISHRTPRVLWCALVSLLPGVHLIAAPVPQDTTKAAARAPVPFEIAADQFSKNHFFVDTTYIRFYEAHLGSDLPLATPEMRLSQLVEVEVWISRGDDFPSPDDRLASAWLNLPPRPSSGYGPEYRSAPDSAGLIESGGFYKLDPGAFEIADGGLTGVITILERFEDDQIIGIAYRRSDGTQIGQFARDLDSGDPRGRLTLKMLRPKDLLVKGPEYPVPWRMMLKNIYPLGGTNLVKEGFTLNIVRRPQAGREETTILGEPILRVLGVDRNGDGVFDYKPEKTISEPRAEIILPFVEPFVGGIERYFEERGGLGADRSILNPEVYLAQPNQFQPPLPVAYFLTGTGLWEELPEEAQVRDTTYVVYMDSTARLELFKAVRTDNMQVDPFPARSYILFAKPSAQVYRREVTIDSTGTQVLFREIVGKEDARIPVGIPLHEYLSERRRYDLRASIADEARKPPELKARDDVGELLSNLTQIQIPVPPNPIFSIFGKPEIKLNISGAVDIKAGFRNTKSDQIQISTQDQTRNEPDFSQDVQVNVNGTIGDKLNILADWNTQRTFEYENQLKINYTGYDDEIVQSVEAGNVSLQTPSTFIGSSQALFGVKAKFQAGPLTLTTLASQKKGEIKEVSVSGGSQQTEFQIEAYKYATNHFFVDTLYRKFYEDYYVNDVKITNGPTQIVEAEVWVQLLGNDPNQIAVARDGIAFITLDPRPTDGYADSLRTLTEIPGEIETSRFIKLNPGEYELTGEGYLGVLSLNTTVADNQLVGIAYRTQEGNQYGELARDLGLDSIGIATRLILKMVKPRNLESNARGYPIAWDQMLKNIYSVGGRNLKKEGFALDIYRLSAGQENQNSILNERLLRVFGLDNFDEQGTRVEGGDGTFDFRTGYTVNTERAEIIFPTLRPFDDGIQDYFGSIGQTLGDSSLFLFPEIYDTTKIGAQNSQNNKYLISGVATGEASSRYTLGFNIVEGSVEVLLDGVPLAPNLDYSVDYIIGEVVIRNSRALVPGANVQIKYEQNDLFQLASKTLLGARGELAFSKTTAMGFTIMNLNQESLSDKVRIGEEPSNNTIFGVDGATTVDIPALTKALDVLPFIATREKSQLKISGEAAYMLPDPNTKKSTIVSDQGAGVAYIDDFEGARRTIPLGISYSQWTLASPPADSVTFSGVADSLKPDSKGRFIWYNVLPSDVLITDVFPNKQVGRDQQQLTVLDFHYAPTTRGVFNYSTDIDNTLTSQQNWGGVMKPISISATNLISENINFIELWLKVESAPADSSAKLVIDLGSISEDVIPNRSLNTREFSFHSEDLVLTDFINGTLQVGEDIGLDMLTNAEEVARYGTTWSPDPSGDNFAYVTGSNEFASINGSEDNGKSSAGLVPDTEDLNANNQVDLINQYFQYELSLDTVRARNPRVVGGGSNGWYQFRIPIIEYDRTVGAPNFENVEFMRAFFRDATDTIWVRIADFNLVGNQWQELVKGDSTFSVTVVNVEDNPEYVSPPGVLREQDRTRPDENILANEQSLALKLDGIPDGESRTAVKFFTFRPLDLFNYRTMKMFVYGDDDFQYVDTTNYDSEVFFLFGYDTLNYYEYRAPIRRGWDPMNDIVVRFEELTAIKQARDSTNIISPPLPVEGGPPGSFYRVLGNPSLTQVRFLAIGVTNPSGKGTTSPLVGQVWVNELRLVDVDDTPGLAYRFDTSLKLADFGSVSFNYSEVDPNFHKLEQRFGSRQTGTNWGASATAQLEKLLPDDWAGTSIPVSYSHTDNFVSPKYLPNSDVLVTEAAQQQRQKILGGGGTADSAETAAATIVRNSETYRTTDTYAAPSIKIGLPSKQWYIRDTFNKLNYGFNYTKSFERNPATVRRDSWSWNARVAYALNFSPDYHIAPFGFFSGIFGLDQYKDFKVFFTPSTFGWSMGLTRGKTTQLQRAPGATQTITRNFPATRQMGFSWKFTEGGILNPVWNYTVNVESSLLDLETDSSGNQRPFSHIMSDIFFGDKLIDFGNTTRHTQQNQYTTKPNLPNIFNMNKYIDHTFSYNVDYIWTNSLVGGDLGKSAGFNNTINYSTNIKLKQIFDPIWGEETGKAQPPGGGRGRRAGGAVPDSASATPQEEPTTKGGPLSQLGNLLRVLIKVPFLDYDNINFSFTQTNSSSSSGLLGGTGFANFWAVPWAQEQDPESGPTRLYQLGLITDPTGRLVNFGPRSYFPFFGWDVEPGRRAIASPDTRVNLINTFRQSNRVNLKTSRGLWDGARLDLNWNINWSFSRNQTFPTDARGYPDFNSISATTSTTGSVERSFLTFPDVLFLGVFNTSLQQVGKRFSELKAEGDSSTTEEQKLAQAFEEGFEAIPWLKPIFGQYYPRVNWTFRWDGLEKLPMFAGFANKVSLDHAYSSGYIRNFRTTPGLLGETTDNQRVSYGFNPLFGLNFTFKELFKGSFGAILRYNTTTSYDLTPSSRNIIEGLTQEISVTASFSKKGFEIPLFGISLNNDIDVSFSYSVAKNSRRTYEVAKLEFDTEGTPLEGTTRTTIEPRIKYVLSLRVNASVYYRYTKIAPDDSGSRIPGQTINEAGLDVHISIR